MKIMIYAQELLSVALTPFVLWFSLPDCAPAIVDFFREFTIHVDTLGYVCSFAVFDFKRHGNVKVSPNLILVSPSSTAPFPHWRSLPQDLLSPFGSLGCGWCCIDRLDGILMGEMGSLKKKVLRLLLPSCFSSVRRRK